MSDNYYYGWGWMVVPSPTQVAGVSSSNSFIGHIGKAIGASSALVLTPGSCDPTRTPHDIAVAVIFNLQEVPKMFQLAQSIAEQFM